MAKEPPIDERLDEIREDDGQIYVERDKVDFDPDDGLLSGTAIDGSSDIPNDPESVAAAEESDDSDDTSENDSEDGADPDTADDTDDGADAKDDASKSDE